MGSKLTDIEVEEYIREYFNGDPRAVGLCYFKSDLREAVRRYADDWEYVLRWDDGCVHTYFIPPTEHYVRTEDTEEEIVDTFEKEVITKTSHLNPMRRKFANFVLEQIARNLDKEFVPIE